MTLHVDSLCTRLNIAITISTYARFYHVYYYQKF